MMNTEAKWIGHLSVAAAYTIFGFNIIICKDLANANWISPLGLFCFRSAAAALLFWLCSLFLPKEKVPPKDMFMIFFASMLGLYLTQMLFLKAIILTTPVDVSIITAITPILVMFVAAAYLKEPITLKKAGGVALSFVGIVLLILNTVHSDNGVAHSQPLGILLMVLNCTCFALYLGLFKRLIGRYHVVTFMKWMFLFSLLASVPFNLTELRQLDFSAVPVRWVWELAYLMLCSTFLAYLFIPIGQKRLRPTVVSMYSYLQPMIACAVSIAIGMDRITWQKLVAAVLVFAGVILVNRSRAASNT
ncbi:MAG: DMT family transporter [Bacteroidales bacterium]|nr:DMT family transporter [Bacteroidales bacterium]MBQ5532055.1 DMT family transporter [Bacteroidales bacterium]